VRYNYSASTTGCIDGVQRADLGLVLGVSWQHNDEVINVYFFNSKIFKLSYAQYLDVVTRS
jgi:hypothetical protein